MAWITAHSPHHEALHWRLPQAVKRYERDLAEGARRAQQMNAALQAMIRLGRPDLKEGETDQDWGWGRIMPQALACNAFPDEDPREPFFCPVMLDGMK